MEASKSKLNEFQSIIVKGQSLGLNMTEISEKFESAILKSKDDIIRIVLLGAFSDGSLPVIIVLVVAFFDILHTSVGHDTDRAGIEVAGSFAGYPFLRAVKGEFPCGVGQLAAQAHLAEHEKGRIVAAAHPRKR